MDVSNFEAAAYYHYKKGLIQGSAHYLVIDLDSCAFGICTCGKSEKAKLVSSYTSSGDHNLWNEFVAQIKEATGLQLSFDIQKELEEQIPNVNTATKNYLMSERLLDSVALTCFGRDVWCSELELHVQEMMKTLRLLLDEAATRLSAMAISAFRIIILGRAQELYWFEYGVRSCVSADPFLADDRFINPTFADHYSKIVEIGAEFFRTSDCLKHTCTLLIFNAETDCAERVCLAEKGQAISSDTDLQWFGPIFLSGAEGIRVELDQKIVNIAVPYSFAPMDSDLVDLAITSADDGSPKLMIRRCRFPTRIFGVELV